MQYNVSVKGHENLIKDCDGGDECSGFVRVTRGHFSEEVTFEKDLKKRRDKPCKYKARMVQARGLGTIADQYTGPGASQVAQW